MLPRRLVGSLRRAPIGSCAAAAEGLLFRSTTTTSDVMTATAAAADRRFSSSKTSSAGGRSSATHHHHGGESKGHAKRRGSGGDGSGAASGGRHITSTAVSVCCVYGLSKGVGGCAGQPPLDGSSILLLKTFFSRCLYCVHHRPLSLSLSAFTYVSVQCGQARHILQVYSSLAGCGSNGKSASEQRALFYRESNHLISHLNAYPTTQPF